mgnify:CR=1 FL=1
MKKPLYFLTLQLLIVLTLVSCVAFTGGINLADEYISAQLPQKLTVYGNLSSNYFKGERYNEIMITDFETEN